MQSHVVIGLGEVGTAVHELLSSGRDKVHGDDLDTPQLARNNQYDFVHICFPYSDNFHQEAKKYNEWYRRQDGLVIIHSTVPIGTTKTLGEDFVFSPVRGVHPNLLESLYVFTKYFGGEHAQQAADAFYELGVPVEAYHDSDSIEALKLFSTAYYAWNIIFQKEVERFCTSKGLDYDLIYRESNISYNDGYEEMNRPEVIRPVLENMPGPIGGHCLIENARLLNSDLAKIILDKNDGYKS